MKEYPKIPGPRGPFGVPCVAFYKYDGSNLRFEYNRKSGWYKFGTKRRLFDHTDPEYGSAIDLFRNKYAEGIERVLRDNKSYRQADNLIVYGEFFGPHSFAGKHDAGFLGVETNDPMDLIIFDINVHKKGFVSPRDFISDFGHLHIPEIIYEGEYTEEFVLDVKEGVICKGGSGHRLWMQKIKTSAYLKELRRVFGVGWSQYWE